MNNYSIEDLKNIITDGMELKPIQGDSIFIQRLPNNIIKISKKSISWVNFRELLISGEFSLIVNEKEIDLFKERRGGVRICGPGKKVGPKFKEYKDKKKVVSFGISLKANAEIIIMSEDLKISKSALIENLIHKEFSTHNLKHDHQERLTLPEMLDKLKKDK